MFNLILEFPYFYPQSQETQGLYILTNKLNYDIVMLSHGMDAFRCGSGSNSAGQGLK